MDVSEISVNVVEFVVPNRTFVAPVNPVPVIVTDVPPSIGPEDGLSDVTAGRAPVDDPVVVVGEVVDEELLLQAGRPAAASTIRIPLSKIDRIL
jgi:hypothetical protein